MESATQENRYTAAWATPEILEGAETITREADVLAFGMVVIEVCPRALPHLVLKSEEWMIHLTSECCLRSLREEIHLINHNPGHHFKDYG